MLRTAFLILSGNAAASLLLLARNLIVARLISVEDYGIAATFAVVMGMVEMASTFGLQQQIVQSKDGDAPRFQAALQGFQFLRGIVSSVILFLIADPIARFLDIPEVVWAYQVLAIVPFIRAFEHFDIHRLNRQMRFWPLLLTGGVPALFSLLIIWPLAAWLEDWRVMLWAILAQITIMTLTSHLVAERPYRLVFDRTIMSHSLRFGWPILVNSVLMFFVFQGDKLIVGHALGMEALAIFAMGMTLTLAPTLVVAKSAHNFFLPLLSTSVGTSNFSEIADRTLQVVTSAALIFMYIILLAGGPILHVILGEKYISLIPILIWFGIGQALRVVKAGPAIVALSLGYTTNAMIANILRVLILPLTWIVAEYSGSILNVLWMMIIGEIAGAVVAFHLLVRTSTLSPSSVLIPQLASGLMIVLIVILKLRHPPNAAAPDLLTWVTVALGMGVLLLAMPAVRKSLWRTPKI